MKSRKKKSAPKRASSSDKKPVKGPKSSKAAYIHGYDAKEQKRLIEQAKFLEPWIYRDVDFNRALRILEIGSGVGAQTKILLHRFPQVKVDAIDFSPRQLEAAAHYLRPEIEAGRVRLIEADAEDLSALDERAYDGAFVCWFLEHVKEPVRVLKEARQRLKKGAPVYISEVFNQTLFVEPYSQAFLKYWFEFNDYQTEIGGHPFIGASLGNLLLKAGYNKVETRVRPFHFDERSPETRAAFIDYFGKILMSAAPALLAAKRVTPSTVEAVRREFAKAKRAKDAVFFYSWIRAVGVAP